MQIETTEIVLRAQVTSFMISQEEVSLLSLCCLGSRTSKMTKALKNRDAEQEGHCVYAGHDNNIPQVKWRLSKIDMIKGQRPSAD